MPVNIKVVYITKYNKKFILNKPDNFAYYIKSIMNSNLIDVHLLNPLPLCRKRSIPTHSERLNPSSFTAKLALKSA